MLNKNFLSKSRNTKAALAFIFFALFINLSCGKRKPPLPPIERTQQRAIISGVQRGNIINITWSLPDKNASDKSVLNITRVDVYRLAEPLTSPLALSEEEFSSRSILISAVPISDSDFTRKQITFTDVLEFAGQPARLRYAIRFVNKSGQKAAFSNFLLIEPTSKVAKNPNSLTATITEKSINLNWKAPAENVDGTTPANIYGYNIYRSENNIEESKIVNEASVSEENFADDTFEFGQNYRYFVRTLSLGADGETLESLNSNQIEISPRDVFAPAAPSSITIAAAPNNLSIFFAANNEKDLAGYKIYRSTNSGLAKKEWTALNTELLTTNTFQDKTVQSGNTYFYYLTAIDNAGNVSQPSEVVSETAP
jgi:hypothetical protein